MFSTPMSCSDVTAILMNPKAQATVLERMRSNSEIESTLDELSKSQHAGCTFEGEGIDEAARKGSTPSTPRRSS